MAAHRWVRIVCIAALAAGLAACSVQPFRPFTKARHSGTPCESPAAADVLRTTPEVPEDKTYTLHFVEFDDQGWAFPDAGESGSAGTPSRQIDCAIADLRDRLEVEGASVLSFVYVHGWKHSADNDDRDVRKFRKLLSSRAALFPDRRIVGIYVAWQGNTVDLWGLRNLTFWGRKNAAHHVAEGRVRELFSRLKGLREYWNVGNPSSEHDCDWEPRGRDRCKLRTIMIGHSFGGLILYNSAAPYLLEILSVDRDLPAAAKRPRMARARGIADLIVLLNPAFEASRYEAVFEASRHYVPQAGEPPILVTLTSTADWATKTAFPAARWVNSVFQYPASSDDQSTAMRRTHGHVDRYLTHTLCMADEGCDGALDPQEAGTDRRRYCGGLVLKAHDAAARSKAIVWNVRTDGKIIPNHNDIDGPEVVRFISQVYSDVTGLGTDACNDDYLETRSERSAADLEQAAPQLR